jgi:prepilin-type processing-associated H-X9-DG protein
MSKLPSLDYGRPDATQGRGNPVLLAAIMIAIFLILFSAMRCDCMPARERANQIKCASILRQMGQYIRQYAQANDGALAPDLQTLLATQQMPVNLLGCPSTDDDPHAKTPNSIGRCSYMYTGAGLTGKSDPACIVLMDDPANHKLEGGNVLFADGHVEFIPLYEIQRILNELNAGRNPPSTLALTLSKAAAEQDYQKNWKPRMPQLKSGVWHIPTTQSAKPQ